MHAIPDFSLAFQPPLPYLKKLNTEGENSRIVVEVFIHNVSIQKI